MALGSVRRSQLIAPFGVGAMMTTKTGISVICCGLDHWFERDSGMNDDIDITEFKVEEWRLKRELEVEEFRMPPDYRMKNRYQNVPNAEIVVPYLRFPRYHYCPYCGHLEEKTLSLRGRLLCPLCEEKGKKWNMIQVPFVAVCDNGHLQDFPFKEWVHKSVNPACTGKLTLKSTGGSTLASQVVKCQCGAERNLANITNAYKQEDTVHTELTDSLDESEQYFCKGIRPWLHDDQGEGCGEPLRGSLRNAANIYFPSVRSAVYLPKASSLVPEELSTLLTDPVLHTLISQFVNAGVPIQSGLFRGVRPFQFSKFSDSQIDAAVATCLANESPQQDNTNPQLAYDDDETAFRREEYNILSGGWNDNVLQVIPSEMRLYGPEVTQFFSKIMLVEKLKETRVLTGFTRIYSENGQTFEDKMNLLWRNAPEPKWLPAYVVHGEGIFFQFDEEKLVEWESCPNIKERVTPLIERYEKVATERHYRQRPLSARFILLHTFAHLIINRLTFECGYSSASLRERLYISNHSDGPMASVLIYTAAGDSEGTMGGLVRMGKPGNLEAVVRRAVYPYAVTFDRLLETLT